MKFLKCLVFLMCVVTLAAFAEGNQEQSGKATAIRFMTTETDPVSVEADKYIIESFENAYPNVKVFPEYVTVGDVFEKILLMAATGVNPDLVYTGVGEAKSLYTNDVLEPVDDVIEEIGDIIPATLSDFDGSYYYIPTQTGTWLYWYRSDLAKRAGMPLPQTREDVKSLVAKMHQGDMYGYTGIGTNHILNVITPILYIWNSGKYIYNEQGTETYIHTKNREITKEVLEYLLDLSKHAPPGFIGTGYNEAGMDLVNERAASLHSATRIPSWVMSTNPDLLSKLNAIPYPTAHGAEQVVWGAMNVWVLFNNSKNTQGAKNFLTHFMTEDRYIKFLHSVPVHLIPVRSTVLTDPEFLSNPVIAQFKDVISIVTKNYKNLKKPATERPGMVFEKAPATWRGKVAADYLNRMYAGKVSVDEAIDAIGAEWNRILSE